MTYTIIIIYVKCVFHIHMLKCWRPFFLIPFLLSVPAFHFIRFHLPSYRYLSHSGHHSVVTCTVCLIVVIRIVLVTQSAVCLQRSISADTPGRPQIVLIFLHTHMPLFLHAHRVRLSVCTLGSRPYLWALILGYVYISGNLYHANLWTLFRVAYIWELDNRAGFGIIEHGLE